MAGQAPLPEQVRIRSMYLRAIFPKNPILDSYSPIDAMGAKTMTRSFKVLAISAPTIRDRYAEWKERLDARFEPAHENKEYCGNSDGMTNTRDGEGNYNEDKGEEEEQQGGIGEAIEACNTPSLVVLGHLECLLEFFDTTISSKLAYLSSSSCQTVYLNDLWHLFAPGENVVDSDGKQAYRVIKYNFKEQQSPVHCVDECCFGETVYNDSAVDTKRMEDYMEGLYSDSHSQGKLPSLAVFPRLPEELDMPERDLSDEDLMIMSHKVFGFVLRNRKWAQLDVGYLSPINVPEGAYGGHAAIEAEISSDDKDRDDDSDFDDGDEKKKNKTAFGRKGLIILLHGAPGVRKTTTAGSTAKEVESALETNFALASRWGCILLLDEADVFLAARKKEDFQRNGLVAGKFPKPNFLRTYPSSVYTLLPLVPTSHRNLNRC
ncbi:aaa family ATPase [Zalerion maritima]|uniref:Aaa family ATPase n=1 Tax=Zalerion maritima TaxID=339359 RepID=A0AAD5WX11_9PEZI|nr:aaa family ATPase [Zalerion maritima]